jgi:hypothetical protein
LRVDTLRPAGIGVVGNRIGAGNSGRLMHLIHSFLRNDTNSFPLIQSASSNIRKLLRDTSV